MADEETPGVPTEVQQAGPGEQLYIKVPGYTHILQDLEGIKQVLANMRESIEVLRSVEHVKQKSIDVFVENVNRLNQQLEDIHHQMPEVQDIEVHIDQQAGRRPGGGEEEVIDESVRELKDELSGLQDELEQLE